MERLFGFREGPRTEDVSFAPLRNIALACAQRKCSGLRVRPRLEKVVDRCIVSVLLTFAGDSFEHDAASQLLCSGSRHQIQLGSCSDFACNRGDLTDVVYVGGRRYTIHYCHLVHQGSLSQIANTRTRMMYDMELRWNKLQLIQLLCQDIIRIPTGEHTALSLARDSGWQSRAFLSRDRTVEKTIKHLSDGN